MRVLVSNDDGIFSPGIKALGLAMRALGEVFVVAPDVEQSAVGHGITVRRPLRFKHTASAGFGEIPAYRVDGTPADCVVLGVHLLGRPDLVVSGINIGVNLGLDLTHSGTVAAALEATSLGIPAIAFSLDTSGEELDFSEAARHAVRIARLVAERGLPKGVLLNVNFPAGTPKGVKVTRLSTHHFEDTVVERLDPEGRPYYWIAGTPVGEEEEGTDLWAVRRGYISITPVSLDFTAREYLDEVAAWVKDL
ncbi:5'-nucleotidase [Thermus sp. 2.9]|uniref:5'/3'-nucleotidase SurE n=1 Tax=Thermus TaxID=270 RepID=UPI000543A043|nr:MULTISPECIES: 5'/3'-nucleotidase SurE [Thermus]KHG64578.1 5'-nucleotidase [Thermus sp. 2.9]